MKKASLTLLACIFVIFLGTALAQDEIPKAGMTADASSFSVTYEPPNAIDGVVSSQNSWTNETVDAVNEWLRIDVGSPKVIARYDYQPPPSWGAIQDYSIYVTNSTSTTIGDWGTPAASGTWADSGTLHQVALSSNNVGRYVILLAENTYDGWTGVSEVWIYESAGTKVSDFSVSDQSTGNIFYTDSATVDVSMTVEPGLGATVTDTMIREIPDEPLAGDAGWSGSGTPPTSYTITGGEGDKTLYAWVKDDIGVIAGTSAGIRYSTNSPGISAAAATPGLFSIQVDWNTDADALGWVMYGPQGGPLDQVSPFSAVGQVHSVLIEGLDSGTAYDLEIHSDRATQALSASTLVTVEIPKAGMTADASSFSVTYEPPNAIDGAVSTPGSWTNLAAPASNEWLRIDLGSSEVIARFDYQAPPGWGAIKNYSIYVTDSTSLTIADWGTPAASGEWPNTEDRRTVALSSNNVGRYVILLAETTYDGWAGVAEVWIYKFEDTSFTAFSVSDQTTGSMIHTDSATVDVSMTVVPGGGATVTDTMIREIPDEPLAGDGDWSGSGTLPTSYTIAGGEGAKTLYAWVMDDRGVIAGKSAGIIYSTATDIITNIVIGTTPMSITLSWDTTAGAIGWVEYGLAGGARDQSTALTAFGTSHSVEIPGLEIETAYDLEIFSNSSTSLLTVSTDASAPTDLDLTWSGASGGGDLWEDGGNWDIGLPPNNPTPGTLTFTDADSGGTSVLDDEVTTWTIGGLQVKNPEVGGVGDINHTIDLGGGRLIVDGDLTVGVYSTDAGLGDRMVSSITFTNGTLQIGTPGNPVNLRLADAEDSMKAGGELIMAPGTTFEAYLDLLQVGNTRQSGKNITLDLRDVTIAGGTLKANNLDVGGGDSGNPTQARRDDGIRVNAGSNLQNIEVAGTFSIGDGDSGDWHTSSGGTSRFGDPDNNWKLPPDVNIKVGSIVSRGKIIIGKSYKPWGGDGLWGFGSLVASSGGTCEAYLTELVVGQVTWGYPNTAEGEFDIRGMDSCTIDVTDVSIGMRLPDIPVNTWSDGIVYLPSGTVVADTMEIGDYAAGATGIAVLGLNDTVFTVNNSANVVHNAGTATTLIDATVGATSSGLDLGGTLDVSGDAIINITFAEPPDGSATIHWGLRWLGDHAADLQALVDAGNLLWDDSGLGDGRTASILESGGYTYVAYEGPEVLDGDVNRDCKVNILDLIAVRNHLNQDPSSPPENAIYDVTGDGSINILDLIYVRNRLNSTCEG